MSVRNDRGSTACAKCQMRIKTYLQATGTHFAVEGKVSANLIGCTELDLIFVSQMTSSMLQLNLSLKRYVPHRGKDIKRKCVADLCRYDGSMHKKIN